MPDEPAAPENLTTLQVADELQTSKTTVVRLIRSGDLPAFKVGRQYRVTRENLEIFKARKPETPETSAARAAKRPKRARRQHH